MPSAVLTKTEPFRTRTVSMRFELLATTSAPRTSRSPRVMALQLARVAEPGRRDEDVAVLVQSQAAAPSP